MFKMSVSLAVVLGILGLNSVQDIRKREICLIPTVMSMAAGLLYRILAERTGVLELAAALLPGLCMMGVSTVAKGEVGMGDALVLLCIGCWRSVDETVGSLLAGLFLASITGIAICLAGTKRTKLPFLPFLLAGEILVVIWR